MPLASVERWIIHSSGGEGRGGLSKELVFCEEFDDMFTHASCREGPNWRSLSLDLECNIVDGLLGHLEVTGLSSMMRSGSVVHVASCNCIVRGGLGLVVYPNMAGSFLGRSDNPAIRSVTSVGVFMIPDAPMAAASLSIVVPPP